jgi:hypothetical protein
MTTPIAEKERELFAKKLDAEVREADARLKFYNAEAEARNAKAEIDELSGLTTAKERVKKDLTELKQHVETEYEVAKKAVKEEMTELQAGIQRFSERYAAWDEARERRYYARIDAMEAKLKLWKAQSDQRRVASTVKLHNELVTLEEKIALAKATAAEARRAKHVGKAQDALIEAAYNLDEAYNAAAKKYEKV